MTNHLLAAALGQLEATQSGSPWYGPSRESLLADITASEAATTLPGGAPSIWGLVLHMTAWTSEVTRRLDGAAADAPAAGDWPAVPTAATEAAWQRACRELSRAHAALLRVAAALPGRRWSLVVPRADGAEDGITLADTVIGVAQHDAYHLGQVALMRRLLRSGPVSG